jgi:hypothetical protein
MIKKWRLGPPEWNYTPTNSQLKRWKRRQWRRLENRALELLRRIEARQASLAEEPLQNRCNAWLFPFRDEIRELFYGVDFRCHEGQLETLRYYLATCPRPMIPICLWLMSRCTHRFHLYEIKEFCNDPSPHVRRHLAKALRKLEAWKLLEGMAATYPGNSAIQWFANAPTSRRSYAERLARYVENIDATNTVEVVSPSRMPYWSLYNPWQGKPQKSLALIREILWRIRQWVHGR